MGVLELMAEYDPFLSTHIDRRGNPEKGNVSYLSSTICHELINSMAVKVKKNILEEARAAKYYSIRIDSTPDISRTDQLTFIIRYLQQKGVAVERFLTFVPNVHHDAKSMFKSLKDMLHLFQLEINNIRGQSYDNATNMSGKYSGLQSLVKENPLAVWIPCSSHSLNLVGRTAISSSECSVLLFDFIETVYSFFSASTYRWEKLKTLLSESLVEHQIGTDLTSEFEDKPITSKLPKRLSETRWSAHADAVQPLVEYFSCYASILDYIIDDYTSKPEVRAKAAGIRKTFDKFENTVTLVFWSKMLRRINAASKKLQEKGLDLKSVSEIYASLIDFIESFFQKFDEVEENARKIAVKGNLSTYYRKDQPEFFRRSKHVKKLIDSDKWEFWKGGPRVLSTLSKNNSKKVLGSLNSHEPNSNRSICFVS